MLQILRNLGRCSQKAYSVTLLGFLCCVSSSLYGIGESSARVDLDTYRSELVRIAGSVARLEAHPEEATALRDSIPEKWVITDQGTTYEVSSAIIAKELEEWQRDPQQRAHLDALQRRIRRMQTEADVFSGPPASAGARKKLDEILNRKEFRKSQDFAWLERLLERIARWIDRHGPRRRSPRSASFPTWIGRALVWTIIVGVCGALGFALWKWIRRTQENVELNLSGGEQFHKRSREWVADALAARRRGDYRDAIRCAYWAAVFRLEELGRWTPNRTRTPREYLRMLPVDHFQRSPLADLTQRFELTWYGYAVATARDFDKVTEQLEKLGCLAPSAATIQKS